MRRKKIIISLTEKEIEKLLNGEISFTLREKLKQKLNERKKKNIKTGQLSIFWENGNGK